MKILLIPAKTLEKQELKFSRSALFAMKTRARFKYPVNDCRPTIGGTNHYTHVHLAMARAWVSLTVTINLISKFQHKLATTLQLSTNVNYFRYHISA